MATCLNLISTGVLLVGLMRIKKMVEEFGRWKWAKDGLYAIHLILFISLTIFEAISFAFYLWFND